MEKIDKSKEFEKHFAYGRGLIPTPSEWIGHFWTRHRERVVAELSPALEAASTVLFVGVGTGDVIPMLKTEGKRLIGIDLNRTFLEQAAAYCETIEGDGSSLPLPSGSCDLVVCNMVLHHIIGQGDLEAAISEAARVLRPGGTFMAFEPNLYHPSGLALSLLNVFRLYNIVAGGSNYEFALSPFALRRICRRHFASVSLRAITFSHPRLPFRLQEALFRLDRPWAGAFPLGFSFALEAKK